jgi:phospholipase/carboxylesterase
MLNCEFYPAKDRDSNWVLIALHGLGDSSGGYRFLPPALDLVWLNYVLVNAPDPYYQGYAWYDFSGDPNPGIVRSRQLLFEVLADQEKRGFSPDRTFIFGFSQGCLMGWEVGLRYPKKLAGIIGVSGYVNAPEVALKEVSPVAREQHFFITHGKYDPLIPFQDVKAQVQMLKGAGLRIEWHEYDKAHTIDSDEVSAIRGFIQHHGPKSGH